MMSSEVHRYSVGDIEVTVLSDGFRMVPLDGYMRNASPEEIKAALAAAGLPADKVRNTYAPIVLATGGKRVLIDTGNGEAAFAQSNGERGRLQHNLAAAGIDRADIDIVVISHFHADHVNGLLTADNARAFPNAEIKVPGAEWRFWMDDGAMSRATEGRMRELFQNNRRVFDALSRNVAVYEWDTEVAPGITALGTPGHSIGHTSYLVSSRDRHVFVQSDVTNNAALFVPNPGWRAFFDQDPEAAEATRRRIYDMLAAEKLPVQAYHHAFPGLSHIDKTATGYRATPLTGLA